MNVYAYADDSDLILKTLPNVYVRRIAYAVYSSRKYPGFKQ